MRLSKSALATVALGGWLAYAGQSDSGPEIRVRLVNEWSGKPLPPQTIFLIEANGKVGFTLHAPDVVKRLRAETGRDGVARFTLSMPLADRVLVDLSPLRTCSLKRQKSEYRPDEIITSGIVISADCVPKGWRGKFHWQDVRAQPGEVIVFGSPPSRGQW